MPENPQQPPVTPQNSSFNLSEGTSAGSTHSSKGEKVLILVLLLLLVAIVTAGIFLLRDIQSKKNANNSNSVAVNTVIENTNLAVVTNTEGNENSNSMSNQNTNSFINEGVDDPSAESKFRDRTRKADLGSLNSSIVLYADTTPTGTYPIQVTPKALSSVPGVVDSSALVTALTAGRFTIPQAPAPYGTNNLSSYWYITNATGTRFSLFTKLENGTNQWFVSNSKGYSDVVTGDTSGILPTELNTECADILVAPVKIYSPCLELPKM